MKPWLQKYKYSMIISTLIVFTGALVFFIVLHPPIHMRSGAALLSAILIHFVGISLELIIVASVINFITDAFRSKT